MVLALLNLSGGDCMEDIKILEGLTIIEI